MKLSVPSGTTSKRIGIFIQDSSSTTGAGLTGLTNGSAGLVCYSWIDTDGNAGGTSQALQSATRGTWTTRGFIEKDATNMPGCYEFGVPDALLAAGVKWAIVMLKGATNMAPVLVEIEVTAVSNQDAVRAGLTALPNANAEAAGGLYTRGTGAGQIEQEDNGKVSINVKQWLRGTIPAVNVTGVPKVDLVDWLGSAPDALSSGKLPADVKLWLAVAMNALIAGRVDSSVGAVAADAITAAAIAADAIGSSELAASAVNEIRDAILSDSTPFAGASVAAIKAKTDNLPEGIKKNTALNNFEFFMADSADHVTGKTGLTVTGTTSIDGGVFAALTNAVTEVASGVYKVNLAAADVNGDVITLKFTAAGADATLVTFKTSP